MVKWIRLVTGDILDLDAFVAYGVSPSNNVDAQGKDPSMSVTITCKDVDECEKVMKQITRQLTDKQLVERES